MDYENNGYRPPMDLDEDGQCRCESCSRDFDCVVRSCEAAELAIYAQIKKHIPPDDVVFGHVLLPLLLVLESTFNKLEAKHGTSNGLNEPVMIAFREMVKQLAILNKNALQEENHE